MDRGSLAGLRRPAEEEWGSPGDAKRACRAIEAGLGEDAGRWTTDRSSHAKSFLTREMVPGSVPGRQSAVVGVRHPQNVRSRSVLPQRASTTRVLTPHCGFFTRFLPTTEGGPPSPARDASPASPAI
ncbi:uncharacterized protein C10orf143 homolog isoform X1 [Gracilinanus agilis]|uniref:uncharacterized protein C10orf143 homolog isoform X1 n=1 Tax=Gracilinanus agilis TaxID=191870 RepID=UPI001CFD4CFF|nr:uncharacterized protein C10orf143 homolog isoform X1 [Gracilinanus agilis]